MSAAPSDKPRVRRQRLPFTLFALAGVMLLKALLLVLVVAGATLETLRPILGFTMDPALIFAIRGDPLVSATLMGFAGLLTLSVIGILLRWRIGWLLGMVVTGFFVALDIYGYMNNGANYLWMGLNILTVFYLNQRDVREAVGAAVSMSPDDAGGVA